MPTKFGLKRIILYVIYIDSLMKQNIAQTKYSFASSLQMLVNIQKHDIELAVVGRGEYKLKEKFQFLEVTPTGWSKMREEQRSAALHKVHTITVTTATSSVASSAISNALASEQCSLLKEILGFGIDWIPQDILASIVTKANSISR